MALKIVQNINLIDNEKDFLGFLEEMGKTSESFLRLYKRVKHFSERGAKAQNEVLVHQFAVETMTYNGELAKKILKDSIDEGLNFEALCVKYPQFRQFVLKHGRK
jgi:hypothetical protein